MTKLLTAFMVGLYLALVGLIWLVTLPIQLLWVGFICLGDTE